MTLSTAIFTESSSLVGWALIWIDRRLTVLAGPDYDATILFGLPIEPEDSQYGKYQFILKGRRGSNC